MATPDGEQVEIDELMVPVITELWRRGYATLRSCQDGGEATLAGTTAAEPDQIERLARINAGRAWVTVRQDAAPSLLAMLDNVEAVRAHRARTEGWTSISWPTASIGQVAELLRQR
jgi:hypothetical protein